MPRLEKELDAFDPFERHEQMRQDQQEIPHDQAFDASDPFSPVMAGGQPGGLFGHQDSIKQVSLEYLDCHRRYQLY